MPTINKQNPKSKKVVKKSTKAKRPSGGFADRLRPVGNVSKGVTLNVYGRNGTGKTRFAATFPKPLMILGPEDGTRSISDVPDVMFAEILDPREIIDAVRIAREEEYATVVLDTATSLQHLVLRDVLELDEIPAQLSWGIARQQDWGQVALQMKEYLRSIIQLSEENINVVIIAQERSFGDKDDEIDNPTDTLLPSVSSALSPSVTGWLNETCDYICNTYIRQKFKTVVTKVGNKKITKNVAEPDEVEFCMRTGPNPIYTVKFRSASSTVVPKTVVNPTFEKLAPYLGIGS